MKQIPLTLFIEKNITSEECFEIKSQGSIIYYQKKYYLITLHYGLPMKSIKDELNNITFTKDDFKLVQWNDLAYIDITLISEKYVTSNLFVFKQFVKKQINVTSNYYFADSSNDYSNWNNIIKYEMNEFFPINMIPGNPSNMYYKMKLNKRHDLNISGCPIYDSKNRLIGIIYMQEDQYIYIIPTTYIIRTLEKKDNNTIYTLSNYEDIIKIGNNKVTKNKNSIQSIYSHKINTRVPLDCYFAFEGDIDNYCIVTLNNLVDEFNKLKISKSIQPYQHNIRKYNYSEFINLLIPNSFNISMHENKIKINSCLFHLMKTCYKDIEIIKKIFSTIIPDEKKTFEHSINNIIYSFENY